MRPSKRRRKDPDKKPEKAGKKPDWAKKRSVKKPPGKKPREAFRKGKYKRKPEEPIRRKPKKEDIEFDEDEYTTKDWFKEDSKKSLVRDADNKLRYIKGSDAKKSKQDRKSSRPKLTTYEVFREDDKPRRSPSRSKPEGKTFEEYKADKKKVGVRRKPASDRPRRSTYKSKPEANTFEAYKAGKYEKEIFFATCKSCGKKCDLPFKPTQGKPVYCRQCFRKKKS